MFFLNSKYNGVYYFFFLSCSIQGVIQFQHRYNILSFSELDQDGTLIVIFQFSQ